jgi:hypothetical protein
MAQAALSQSDKGYLSKVQLSSRANSARTPVIGCSFQKSVKLPSEAVATAPATHHTIKEISPQARHLSRALF